MSSQHQRTDLRDDEVQALYDFRLENTVNGKLRRGSVNEAAERFNVSRRTVGRIRSRAKSPGNELSAVKALEKNYKGCNGRPRICSRKIQDEIKKVPLKERGTYASLSESSGISSSTLCRSVQRGVLKSETRRVKPLLTVQSRISRVKFCLSHVNRFNSALPFYSMMRTVHIDEKWFYIMSLKVRTIIVPGEKVEKSSAKSNRFITKVIFLAAVAHPRYDSHSRSYFDGNIGIWPFVETRAAKRTSVNRPKGTPVTSLLNVDRNVYRNFIAEKLYPAIRDKFPS